MYTAAQVLALVMSAKCEAACLYENFDSGKFENKKCVCMTFFETKDIFGKKLKKQIKEQSSED